MTANPGDLGTPPGAVTLRGATGFRTPAGWDTVYGPVLNMIERPFAPMLGQGTGAGSEDEPSK